jgi:hypothetical protein
VLTPPSANATIAARHTPRFLDLWKAADRDVPILRAALREYATVR